MSAKALIDYLSDESTFFAIIDALDNITNGCRVRISPEDEMRYCFLWVLNEMMFRVTSDDSGTVGKSLAWLTTHSSRILDEMNATNLVSEWMSLPERVKWVTAFNVEVLRRNFVNQGANPSRPHQGRERN